MRIQSRVRRSSNCGSTAEFAASESRRLPSSGGGGGNREGTRGAEGPPVRCLSRRTLETVSESLLAIRVVSLGVRSHAWVGPPAGVCLVLLSGPPVGSGRLALSSGFVLGACFFPFF